MLDCQTYTMYQYLIFKTSMSLITRFVCVCGFFSFTKQNSQNLNCWSQCTNQNRLHIYTARHFILGYVLLNTQSRPNESYLAWQTAKFLGVLGAQYIPTHVLVPCLNQFRCSDVLLYSFGTAISAFIASVVQRTN